MEWNTYFNLLLNGDYDKGWPDHDSIINNSPQFGLYKPNNYNRPTWTGLEEPITLLVNAEFGDGDTVHFYRFIEKTKNRVSKLFLRCNEDFKDLFSGVNVVGKDHNLPHFDKIIHMMALPRVLGIRKGDISGKPYLTPNQIKKPIEEISTFPLLDAFKVGVCCAGNPFNPADIHRSIDPSLFNEFFDFKNVCFFSLNNIFDPPKNSKDVRHLMKDWNQTAHLINAMDLVITVDTSIAHVAGALGKPVWVLVSPAAGEWRWGQSGTETIWYESMKIFRKKDSWKSLIKDAIAEFKQLLNSKSSSFN